MAKIDSPLSGTFSVLKRQFIAKEKLIKTSLLVQRKNSANNVKNAERERNINYEKKIEGSLKFIGRPIKSAISKKLGFFDSIKRYLVSVLLGFIGIRLIKYLPQLVVVLKGLMKISDFFINYGGKILNSLASFIDWGYKAYDTTRKNVGKDGGEEAIKNFDNASSQINTVIQSVITAGMLFSDFGGVGSITSSAGKAINSGIDFIKDVITEQGVKNTAKEGLKRSILTVAAPAAAVLGAGLLSSAVGEGLFQLKKSASKFSNLINKSPFLKFLSGPLKVGLWILNGMGLAFDVVGAPFRYGIELIRAGVMKLNDDRKGLEEQNKNLGKFDARVRDGVREHIAFLAPAFKLIGMNAASEKLQKPGSFGSFYGDKATKNMGYGSYGGGIIKKFAGGGSTTENVGANRTIKKVKTKRTIKETPTQLKPGSAVGGYDSITELFPNPNDSSVMNPYKFMISSHYTISSMGSIGPLMSLMTKVILGDKIGKEDYSNVSKSLNSFLMQGISQENTNYYNKMNGIIDTNKLALIVERSIVKVLEERLGDIENQLRIQLGLKPIPGGDPTKADQCLPCPDGGGGAVSGDSVDKAILDLIASVESGGYDSVNTSYGSSIGKPTSMTIEEIGRKGRGATGRYQHMPEYLVARAQAAGVDIKEKFTPANQDKITMHFLRTSHPYDGWKKGQVSDVTFGKALAKTWRGLPYSESGTYSDGTPNKAHISWDRYMASLRQIKSGSSTTNISPSSPAANVDPCVCDPTTPNANNIGAQIQPAGETAGGSVSGYPITSRFGWRWGRNHGGIDIGAPSGKPIAINVPGEVVFSGWGGGYGNVVDIWVSSLRQMFRMAHMRDKPSVTKGQKTVPGQLLGYVGSTGNSTGPHIHFESHDTITSSYGNKDPMPYAKYLSVGREIGGPTLGGGIRKLHKGEYVIDKDSVDFFGGVEFFQLINNIENDNQRSSSASKVIQHLSKYTNRKMDNRPEIIVGEESYEIVSPPPVNIFSGESNNFDLTEINWEQDMCYARG